MTMQTLWVAPHDIEDCWSVNNRTENSGHIDSLAESMIEHGYFLKYPIVIFKADGLGVLTDKPYVMACGHHRRKGAIQAKIEQVLCEVHEGTEEEWIEMMAMDNFKFDVVKNPGVGLAFTATERRAACRQMLLLPKYMEQTNVALSKLWNVPESTIRRWRNEVEKLIEKGSDMLEEWMVSESRLKRLKEIIASETRLNDEGQEVSVARQTAPEMTESERSSFWYDIRSAFWSNRGSDGHTFDERHGLDRDDLENYVILRYDLTRKGYDRNGYDSVSKYMKDKELREIHNFLLTSDAAFVKQLTELRDMRIAYDNAYEQADNAHDALMDAFHKHLAPSGYNVWDTPVKNCLKAFKKAIADEYDGAKVDDWNKSVTIEQFNVHADFFLALVENIEQDRDWIKAFKKAETKRISDQRTELELNWVKIRQALLGALEAYRRNIPIRTFWLAFENHFYGYGQNTMTELQEPTGIEDSDLKSMVKDFRKSIKDIKADAHWIKSIEEPTPLVEMLTEPVILHLTIQVGGGNPCEVEFDAENIAEWVNPGLRENLLKIAQSKHIHDENMAANTGI